MVKKGKKRILIAAISLFALGLLFLLVIKVISGFREIQDSLVAAIPPTHTIPLEDSTLIAKQYWSMLKPDQVYNRGNGALVSFLLFDNQYHLITYKIDLTKDQSLKDLVKIRHTFDYRSTGKIYTVVEPADFYSFQFLSSATKPVSEIFLTLADHSLLPEMNDSIINYHLLCHTFSIRYGQEEPIDIFLSGKEGLLGFTDIIPMDLIDRKSNV